MYDFDPEHPQYRTKRRDANILVKELQKREHLEGHAEGALHMHGCRGKNYWEETLRQDNAESQFTTNERADPEERVNRPVFVTIGGGELVSANFERLVLGSSKADFSR